MLDSIKNRSGSNTKYIYIAIRGITLLRILHAAKVTFIEKWNIVGLNRLGREPRQWSKAGSNSHRKRDWEEWKILSQKADMMKVYKIMTGTQKVKTRNFCFHCLKAQDDIQWNKQVRKNKTEMHFYVIHNSTCYSTTGLPLQSFNAIEILNFYTSIKTIELSQ